MSIAGFATLYSALALLVAVLALPLVLRKVPMNPFYGMRLPRSFRSERDWYEINAYGGKALLFASIPILLTGLAGFAIREVSSAGYTLLAACVTCISVAAACFVSCVRARSTGKGDTSHEGRELR